MTTTRAHDLMALASAYDALGPNGRETLLFIAGRLVAGAREHGDFDDDARDYHRDESEEDADAIVYRVRQIIRARRRSRNVGAA